MDSLQASLSDFTHVSAVNQTRTSLDSLGGALTVTIEAGSSLILHGTSDLTTLILGEHASLTLQGLTADAVVVDITGTSNYTPSHKRCKWRLAVLCVILQRSWKLFRCTKS